jgi:phage shock protein PspC (stress-responsive transcriptional regulator)
MKKIKIILLLLLLLQIRIIACPVCERNQPKLLKGIVHGAGPESNWDYVSIVITAIIALVALVYSIKWLIKPNEKNSDHIKYSILN